MRRGWPLWVGLGVSACAGLGPTRQVVSPVGSTAGTAASQLASRELPSGWGEASAFGFERMLAEWSAGGREFRFSRESAAELEEALARGDALSVRAAVLAGWSADPSAADLLIERLETRRPARSRALDAGDVVAAAALAGRGRERGLPVRLSALAVGPEPHPDLEVRVECARSALASGRDEVVPLLVRVLRAATPMERDDPPDWEPTETLAWSKSRAAEALCEWAGVACGFRADGSFAHQASEVRRVVEVLGL